MVCSDPCTMRLANWLSTMVRIHGGDSYTVSLNFYNDERSKHTSDKDDCTANEKSLCLVLRKMHLLYTTKGA